MEQQPIELTNQETAAKYEALTHIDQRVHVPARQGIEGKCYNGMISGITPDAAERYVRWGGNLIARKATVATSDDHSENP